MNYFLWEVLPALIGGALGALIIGGLYGWWVGR